MEILADGEWHDWSDVVTEMLKVSDILPVTASNLLHTGVSAGMLHRKGSYNQGTRQIGR